MVTITIAPGSAIPLSIGSILKGPVIVGVFGAVVSTTILIGRDSDMFPARSVVIAFKVWFPSIKLFVGVKFHLPSRLAVRVAILVVIPLTVSNNSTIDPASAVPVKGGFARV